MEYNKRAHARFHRVYNIITSGIYLRKCDRRFKVYIKHCPDCQLLQISRHVSYEVLYLIIDLFLSFYIITADFVLALSKTKDGINYLLTIIYKFFKKIELIPGKKTYTVVNQTKIFFAVIINQKILSIFIRDRDSKSISKFQT